jgi:hypothetical protein
MKKQTAVEWLYNNLKSHFEHNGDLLEVVQFSFEQAKEIEKQQIIEAWMATDNPLQRMSAEQYYKDTFKNK